jgi:hypothetical protein
MRVVTLTLEGCNPVSVSQRVMTMIATGRVGWIRRAKNNWRMFVSDQMLTRPIIYKYLAHCDQLIFECAKFGASASADHILPDWNRS